MRKELWTSQKGKLEVKIWPKNGEQCHKVQQRAKIEKFCATTRKQNRDATTCEKVENPMLKKPVVTIRFS